MDTTRALKQVMMFKDVADPVLQTTPRPLRRTVSACSWSSSETPPLVW